MGEYNFSVDIILLYYNISIISISIIISINISIVITVIKGDKKLHFTFYIIFP